MSNFGKLEYKEKTINLRKEGLSYSEILKIIPISKDTVSRWCRDIKLSSQQQANLMAKKANGQKKGSIIAAERKRQLRIENLKTITATAKREIGKISSRDNFVFGLALYSGEGGKTDGKGTFTNSDPLVIKFMSDWIEYYCQINKNKMKGAIWIHEENDEEKAIAFWASLTRIPVGNFHKSYIVKRKDNASYRKNVHPYGVFSIRFYDSNMQRKILGWISAFLGDKIAITQ